MKAKILLSAVLGLGLAISGTSMAKDWKEIRVAIDPTYKPFTFKTAEGKPTGFDVDIAEALCAQVKAKCVFIEQAWDGMIPGLLAKKYDTIISSMSITEERRQQVNFTDKYYNTPSRVVVKKSDNLSGTPSSLKGKKLGVLKGSTQEKFAKDILAPAGALISSYEAQDQVYLDIKAGRIEGTVADVVEVSDGFLKTPDGASYGFVGPELNAKKYFGEGVGVALRKADNDLKNKLNAAIKAIRSNGTYKKLNDKYFDFNVYGS